jgi:hypothetical protein
MRRSCPDFHPSSAKTRGAPANPKTIKSNHLAHGARWSRSHASLRRALSFKQSMRAEASPKKYSAFSLPISSMVSRQSAELPGVTTAIRLIPLEARSWIVSSRRGNGYLRTLFIQGARAVLLRRQTWPKHGSGAWLEAASKRLHSNVLVVALAAKLARMAWSMLAKGRDYDANFLGQTAQDKTRPEGRKEDPRSDQKDTISCRALRETERTNGETVPPTLSEAWFDAMALLEAGELFRTEVSGYPYWLGATAPN